jgi:hypothetical protein
MFSGEALEKDFFAVTIEYDEKSDNLFVTADGLRVAKRERDTWVSLERSRTSQTRTGPASYSSSVRAYDCTDALRGTAGLSGRLQVCGVRLLKLAA